MEVNIGGELEKRVGWALGESGGMASVGDDLEHRERGVPTGTAVWTPYRDAGGRRGRKGGPRRKKDTPWTGTGAQPRTKPIQHGSCRFSFLNKCFQREQIAGAQYHLLKA